VEYLISISHEHLKKLMVFLGQQHIARDAYPKKHPPRMPTTERLEIQTTSKSLEARIPNDINKIAKIYQGPTYQKELIVCTSHLSSDIPDTTLIFN
jgi:hypothetical protein